MALLRLSLLCSLLLSVSLNAGEATPKSPVPDAAKVAEVEKTIKDIFKDEYAKRGVEDRKALAQKLLQQGDETRDDAASRYVLLKEAAALATMADDADTMLKALDALGKHYEIDAAALKAEALNKITAKTADAAKVLARAYLRVLDEAIAADSYDAALKLAASGESTARKAQDMGLLTQFTARGKEARALQMDFAKLKAAQATLKEKPDDPESNLAVGRFLSFIKRDWAQGLPLLAKGADAVLKDLAEKELAGRDAEKTAAVPDGWWAFAEKQTGTAKDSARLHAAALYRDIVGRLTGLEKTRVEKRLQDAVADEWSEFKRRKPYPITIYATFDNSGEIYIDGEKVMTGKAYGTPPARATIQLGSIITVKLIDEGAADGFSCVMKVDTINRAIVTDLIKWKCYKPQSDAQWFATPDLASAKKVRKGSNQGWKNTTYKESGVECEAIWGETSICYLVLQVTEDCLLPLK